MSPLSSLLSLIFFPPLCILLYPLVSPNSCVSLLLSLPRILSASLLALGHLRNPVFPEFLPFFVLC